MANQILYGFMNLQTMLDQRVTAVGVDVVNTAITQSVEEHNRQMAAIMALFAIPTDKFKVRFKSPVAARLQPLDENGRARPIQVAGYYDVAFPLQSAGSAWGANHVTREKMTVQEANNITNTMLSADVRWLRDHVLAALFDNAGWSYSDDDDDVGTLSIKGPANGDTDTYLVQAGADTGTTDDHFLAQAGAIADATNPLPTIYTELTEHPENTGDVITFVPTANKAAAEALTGFVKARRANDPVQQGSTADILVADLSVAVPGKVFGYCDDQWLVHWPTLPTDYLLSVMTGGERALGMREHAEASLKGFQRVGERTDHPFYEAQWERHAGFGAWNRVGVVIQRVGNGTYAVPTNYSTPMP
ncbi:MAG: hypothetical protein ACOYYS_09985 [Chloroflexota bacterium]